MWECFCQTKSSCSLHSRKQHASQKALVLANKSRRARKKQGNKSYQLLPWFRRRRWITCQHASYLCLHVRQQTSRSLGLKQIIAGCPVRESHFCGLIRQVGRRMFVVWSDFSTVTACTVTSLENLENLGLRSCFGELVSSAMFTPFKILEYISWHWFKFYMERNTIKDGLLKINCFGEHDPSPPREDNWSQKVLLIYKFRFCGVNVYTTEKGSWSDAKFLFGPRTPLASKIFFKIMQCSGNLKGKTPIMSKKGFRPPGVKTGLGPSWPKSWIRFCWNRWCTVPPWAVLPSRTWYVLPALPKS